MALLDRLLPGSLRGRLALVLIVVGTVAHGGFLFQLRELEREQVVRMVGERLEAQARSLAARIDGNSHEALASVHADQDAVTSWAEGPPEALSLHHIAQQEALALDLATATYTLRLRPEARDAVVAEPDREHPEAMSFVITSAENPYWHHPYEYRPAMKNTLLYGEPAVSDLYSDGHGAWLSAYAPVTNGAGEVVALLEMDAPMEEVLAEIDHQVGLAGTRLAGLGAILLFAVLALVQRLSAGMARLERAAIRIGEGDTTTEVGQGGLVEVARLAKGLEAARRSVDLHHRRLGAQAADLLEQLDAVQGEVSERDVTRRRRLVEARERLSAQLDVPRAGQAEGRVVDLTPAQVQLDVPDGAPLDLAIGMEANLGLNFDGEPAFVARARVSRRASRDGMQRYTLLFVGEVDLERLPTELGRLLAMRSAVRARPAPEAPVRVELMLPWGTPLTVSTRDVSESGMSLVVPAPLDAVSTWGTELGVSVQIPGHEGALPGRVRVMRVTSQGTERCVLGVALVDPEHAPVVATLRAYVQQRLREEWHKRAAG